MEIPRDAVLLRIFFGEDDKFNRLPLHEAIVLKAREMHLGGATVLRGHVGFGHSSHIHTTKILRLSQDLPVVVEIVDSAGKNRRLPPRAGWHDDERTCHHRESSGPSIWLYQGADRDLKLGPTAEHFAVVNSVARFVA